MTLPSPFRADAVRIEEPIASLLIDLGPLGSQVPTLALAPAIALSFGPLELKSIEGNLARTGPSLLLTVPRIFDVNSSGIWNQAGRLELADGSTVEARFCNWKKDSMSIQMGNAISRTTTFELDVWEWKTSRPAIAWVGELPGLKFRCRNLGLHVRDSQDTRLNGLRLEGHYTWYIFGREDQTALVVIDGKGQVPEFEALGRDFVAMADLDPTDVGR